MVDICKPKIVMNNLWEEVWKEPIVFCPERLFRKKASEIRKTRMKPFGSPKIYSW